jgi:hypothetical protein
MTSAHVMVTIREKTIRTQTGKHMKPGIYLKSTETLTDHGSNVRRLKKVWSICLFHLACRSKKSVYPAVNESEKTKKYKLKTAKSEIAEYSGTKEENLKPRTSKS